MIQFFEIMTSITCVCSLVVMIPAFQAGGLGSIPGGRSLLSHGKTGPHFSSYSSQVITQSNCGKHYEQPPGEIEHTAFRLRSECSTYRAKVAATNHFKIYFHVNIIKVAFGTNPRGDKIVKETMRPSAQDPLETSLHVRFSGDIVRFTRERSRVRSWLPVWL